jgi:histidinol-phosphate phosphatase family protein
MKNRAVFLDRDGTIAPDVNYCRRPEDFNLFPDAGEAVKLLNNHGFKVVVITNQSGIARGYFTVQILARIHQKMADELGRSAAKLDAVYYCPHHPDEGCECRKPKTALFHQAVREMDIELDLSYVVGDSSIDIEAGKTLGCKTILVTTGPKQGDRLTRSDYTSDSLIEAVQWILKDTQSAQSTM